MSREPPINLIQKAAERMYGGDTVSVVIPRAPAKPIVTPLQGRRMADEPPLAEPPLAEPPFAEPRPEVTADTAARAEPRQPASRRLPIDLARLARSSMIVPGAPKSRLAEEFRLIKRPLLRKAFREQPMVRRGNVIMVTSARPGEGKTFTALNLIMSLASEANLNILAVDADIAKASLTSWLGVPNDRGLIDLAREPKLNPADALIRADNLPNLSILPAGRGGPDITELMASPRMETIIDDLATRYADRVLVIDTPPVLSTSETSVMAVHVGQTVLVVGARQCGPNDLGSALKLLSACPSVSFAMNRTSTRQQSHDFGANTVYS